MLRGLHAGRVAYTAAALRQHRHVHATLPSQAIDEDGKSSWIHGSIESNNVEGRHQFPVSQFGRFTLETAIPVVIRSLDGSPECPEIGVVQMVETAVIDVVAKAGGSSVEGVFEQVQTDNEGHDLSIRAVCEPGHELRHELQVWLPFSMGVDVKATDAAPKVLVRSLEGGVSVDSDGGLVELKSIKGGQVDVVTNTGDVTGTSLQGDVTITTVEGNIDLGKVQALDLNLTATGTGSIMARALYANNTNVHTDAGAVTLGAVHGKAAISSNAGSIKIGTAEGNITITTKTGSAAVHLNECDSAECTSSSGSITVSMLEDQAATVLVQEPGTTLHGSVTVLSAEGAGMVTGTTKVSGEGTINGGGFPLVVGSPEGKVTINTKSWFEASMESAALLNASQ